MALQEGLENVQNFFQKNSCRLPLSPSLVAKELNTKVTHAHVYNIQLFLIIVYLGQNTFLPTLDIPDPQRLSSSEFITVTISRNTQQENKKPSNELLVRKQENSCILFVEPLWFKPPRK